MAGIYFHIPFCKQACHYCDFHFSTQLDQRTVIVKAMISELNMQKDYLRGETVETIYFGGGTPSLLDTDELNQLLESTYNNFAIAGNVEITLEANPDDLTKDKLAALKSSGINRLSVGIQSFDDTVLKSLNRAHDSSSARQSFQWAREMGFHNISVDLMFAIPQQTDESFYQSLDQVLQLSPDHISIYSLTIEPKTAFGKWKATGKLVPVSEERAARQYEVIMEKLTSAGFDHYEISNFGKPGFYSRHNSSYWKQKSYLGIGPSAHSYDGASRQFNISNNALYIKGIQSGLFAFEKEILTRENKINEFVFTTLRTSWGCDLKALQSLYHYDLEDANHTYIHDAIHRGLLRLDNHTLTLTRKGKLIADQIAADLFVEDTNES